MTLIDWIPAVSTSALLTLVAWLSRHLLLARLTKAIEHEFDAKLEVVRSRLAAKEAEIAALRAGALAGLVSRQAAVDKRRLEAVDQVWSAVTALGQARTIAILMSAVKFEEAASAAERDPKIRSVFDSLAPGFDPKSIDLRTASNARPFLTPMAWATYSAIVAISMFAVSRWNILRSGLGPKDVMNTNAIGALLKSVIPSYSERIDQHGPSGWAFLLDVLEARLLAELEGIAQGTESDEAGIERAALLLRRSSEALQRTAMSPVST